MHAGRTILVSVCGIVLAATVAACTNLGDVLDVPPPAGVATLEGLQSRSAAEGVFNGAKGEIFSMVASYPGVISLGGLLSDEFVTGVSLDGSENQNIDARITHKFGNYFEQGNAILTGLLDTRSRLLLSAIGLRQFEPDTELRKVGEAFALVGYIEIFLAEDYCAGVPLSRVLPGSGIEYGHPLTTDSLLAVAEAHFDSALANAHGDANVTALASLGLARARLNRGHFSAAASAAAAVPTGFVYQAEMPPDGNPNGPNLYTYGTSVWASCSNFNVGDREGANGLDFISANDPRLVLDTTVSMTCERYAFVNYGSTTEGAPWYYPVKFGNPSQFVPFATGVEARLIEAEAALQQSNVAAWAAALNTLRDSAASTYLQIAAMPHLTSDSTTAASTTLQQDVLFRERAFWLYGTGTRLGDLRRLIRQYGRTAATVFPTGVYHQGVFSEIPDYGADVSLTLPTVESGTRITNPYYQGCLTSAATP